MDRPFLQAKKGLVKPMRYFAPLITSLFAIAALSACSTTKIAETFDTRQNAGPCPPMGSIYDVSRYVSFANSQSETYDNIAFTGEITDVRLLCRYADDDPLIAQVDIDFAFGKGNAATSNSHVYPYFVAVTRRNGKVLHKEEFAVEANFGGGVVTGATETIGRITIPRVDESISGANFEILVGFSLTPEQLAFNRAGKRFRLDAQD